MIVVLENEGYRNIPPVSKTESSWTVNSLNIGVLLGAILTSYISDIIGKKYSLLLAQGPLFLSHIIIYFAKSVYMIYVSIILRGISLGMGYGCIPNYISEVTSPPLRGPSTVFGMLLLPVGGLIGGVVQATASISQTTIVMAIIGLCIVPFLFLMPESPYYFVAKKQDNECKRTLRKLRRTQNVDKEFLEIQTTWNDIEKTKNISLIELFRNNKNRRVFLICAGTQIVQQTTGYLPLFAFSHDIIFESGLNWSLLTITILINIITILLSIISMFVIEKLGRRLLFIIVCSMVILGLGMLGSSFYFEHDYKSIWFGILKTSGMLMYLSAFGLGLGFFHNLLAAELFPSDFKSKGVSIIVMLQAIEGTIVTTIYGSLFSFVDYLPFFVFFVLTVLGLIFGYLFIPETKNKSLAEIQKDLNITS